MFLFIIPRTPVRLRTEIRNDLWELTKKSLLAQTTRNWHALVLSDQSDGNNDQYFTFIEADEYKKNTKLEIALRYIKTNNLRPHFLIRLDEDDLISPHILQSVEENPLKYDVYFDPWHVYIDLMYLKISHRKNRWIANTAIHRFEHALEYCGPLNIPLIIQDHSSYWHIYYADKKTFTTSKSDPIYYRILSPSSITSTNSDNSRNATDANYLAYLTGYGPWKSLKKTFSCYESLISLRKKYYTVESKSKITYSINNSIRRLKKWLYDIFYT